MKKIMILLILLLIITMVSADVPWLETWAKRRAITVSNTNIDSNLTHFPLLITLGTSIGTGSTDVSSIFDELTSDANRKKIAITKSDGTTQIYAEIEKWDDTNEKAWLWVSKSDLVLSSSDTTTLYFYYDSSQPDNTTYVGDPTDAVVHNVWNDNFKMVQHMGDDPDTSSISDSTQYANDGTKKASNEPIEADGNIAEAQNFDKTDDKIDCGAFQHLPIFTLETWIKTEVNVTDYWTIIDKEENYQNRNYWLSIDKTTGILSLRFSIGGVSKTFSSTESLNDNIWHHVVATYDNSHVNLYSDDTSIMTPAEQTGTPEGSVDSQNFIIGYESTSNPRVFGGSIDEVRISAIARGVDWIKANYYSETDAIASWGNEEESGEEETTCDCPESGNWEIDDGSNCVLSNTCNLSGTIRISDGSLTLTDTGELNIASGFFLILEWAATNFFTIFNGGKLVVNA